MPAASAERHCFLPFPPQPQQRSKQKQAMADPHCSSRDRPAHFSASPVLVSLSLLLLAFLCPVCVASNISYVTYGPGIVNDAGYSALYALYNRSYVAFQPSLPSVSIGLSVSLGTDVRLSGLDTALQYAVELLNFRGGVVVRGVQQYVSVTYAVDGSSSSEAAAIYGAMLQWGNITAFLAPSSDALLQAVSTKLAGAALTLAVDDRDPASYGSGEAASYLFSQLNTATSTWTAALHSINAQAQTYAAAGGSASANGIKTLCMFSTADSLTQAAAAGVRAWIAAENARRGNTDNITVYADRVWYCNATGTYKDYVPFLSACPDAVDVMLLQDANVDELAVAAALTDSQLRPRAVLGINPNNVQLSKTPTAAQGWTLALSTASRGSNSTLGRYGGKFTSYTDAGTGLHYWCAGAGLSAAVPVESYLYFAALDVLLAAFNQSASLTSAADLAAGLLSLNGSSSILGPLAFDPVTGINVAAQMYTAQVLANGSPLLITPSTNLTYPWPWPHALTKPDPIDYITYGPGVVSPMGVAYLLADHNASYVPRNVSAPTLNIGFSLSLGEDSLLTGMDVAVQYIVDSINFRGGIQVAGVAHYLSITYATDGASPELTQYIYEDMYLSGQYALYLAPQGDMLLQSLSSFLSATQAFMFSVYNEDTEDYGTPHTNLVSLFNTADAEWTESLNIVNTAAQLYAAAGGDGSLNGIKTFCMFSTNDTLVQAAAEGVRQWIAAENERRGNNDNITVYVDSLWATNITGSYLDYVPYLSACPDGVDLMLLQDGSTTTLNAQLALRDSQLRPRAAVGLDPETTLLGTGGMAVAAAGWTYPLPASTSLISTLPAFGGKWSGLADVVYGSDVWAAGANLTGFPYVGYAYVATIDIIAAALNQSKSVQPADVRAALQGLNGQTGLVTGIEFNNVTGVNVAAAYTVIQILSDGAYSYLANQSSLFFNENTSALIYPYNWPWRGLVQPGDSLEHEQNNSLAIIGVVICVLGAWVAQIIVEQSIFERRRGGWWRSWLCVVALALGGVSIWAAQLMAASGLTVCKPQSSSLEISFAMGNALLAWLPAIVPTWIGLILLMGDVESHAVTAASKASQTHQTLREQKEAKKKRAALSNSAHLAHLWNAITWRAIIGGLCIALAIGATRSELWFTWHQDATFSTSGWAWVVTTMFNALCVPLAMLMYFHALRWRVAAVFLFAICVMVDYQVQLAGLTFYYEPGAKSLPSSLQTADVDSTIVTLIAGIIAAFICFIFIGLQFSRMRLSRNGLSVLVASLEQTINQLKSNLRTEKVANAQKDQQLALLARMLELVNTASPIATEYAFALSAATTHASYTQLLYSMAPGTQSTSGSVLKGPMLVRRGTHASTVTGAASVESEGSRSSAGQGLRSASSMKTELPCTAVEETACLSTAAAVGDRLEADSLLAAHVRASSDQQRSASTSPTMPTKVLPPLAHRRAVTMAAIHPTSTSPPLAAVNENQPTIEPPLLEHSNTVRLTVDSAEANAADILGVPTAPSSPSPKSPKRISTLVDNDTLITLQTSPRSSQQATQAVVTPTNQSSVLLRSNSKRQRSYEDELQLLMDAQQSWRDDNAAGTSTTGSSLLTLRPKRVPGNGAAGTGNSAAFDLNMPLLGMARESGAAVSMYASPSLLTLLSHPVCVEVLKAELQQVHSVENLIFYLHAVRYRHVQSAKLRKLLAVAIHDHFIRENAPQQININTRQRDAITATVARRGDDCPAELFREAEREVLLLMETNVMKALTGTATMRLCSWVLASVPTSGLTEPIAALDESESTRTPVLYDVRSSIGSFEEPSVSKPEHSMKPKVF